MKVFCLGDKPPDGVRVLSHAELEHFHYEALKDPAYRAENLLMEIQASLEPCHYQERAQQAPETLRKPPEVPQRISYQLDQIKAQLLHQQKKLDEHLAKKGKRNVL